MDSKKVIFILGSTGTGKSKLAIRLALRFNGEVVNSDKMQLYSGLDIITNKVTEEESFGVPHHLLGVLSPKEELSAEEFRAAAVKAVEGIIRRGKRPIIAGGSNSYIRELVEGNGGEFRGRYEICFIWLDVEEGVLGEFVGERVERMLERGMLGEARGVFEEEKGDYMRGIRRAIGVGELHRYFESELEGICEEERGEILREAIGEIKENTCRLMRVQRRKIRGFGKRWRVRRVDATRAVVWREDEGVWEKVVWKPSERIVKEFLSKRSFFFGFKLLKF